MQIRIWILICAVGVKTFFLKTAPGHRCESVAEPLWSSVSRLVCSRLKKQGATGSLRSQTEVKLFAAPQLWAQTCWDLQKATESLCFVSLLQHTCRRIDLLQSFHRLSNYMKLLVYYRLSEYPARFIRVHSVRWELRFGIIPEKKRKKRCLKVYK